MKYIQYLLFSVLIGLTACFNPPEFPNAPEIAFKSIEGKKIREIIADQEVFFDSIAVTISFTDGDGDLGLASTDILPPYQPFTVDDNGNEVANYFHHNYHLIVKRINNGVIEPVTLPNGLLLNKKSRFPIIIDDKGPVEGELTFGDRFLTIAGSGLNQLDTIFFEITIIDRALNISNTVETDPIVIGDY